MNTEGLGQYIDEWCVGKSRWWRVLILLVFVQQWWKHLSDPLYAGYFSGISLGLHEAGHVLFGFFGEWLMVAGGTITQVAAPIIAAVLFFRQPDFFAIAVCGGWLSDVLFDVATYMGDATKLELDVVTIGGGEPITPNDWRYLLDSVGLLLWDERLASALRLVASLVMIGSLGFGCWLLLKMGRKMGS
jgi:hypothetical protein